MYKDSNLLSVPSDPVKPSALQTGEQHLIENQLKELVYLLYMSNQKTEQRQYHSHPLFSTSTIKVEDNGFEPLTPCVQGRCSSQLS